MKYGIQRLPFATQKAVKTQRRIVVITLVHQDVFAKGDFTEIRIIFVYLLRNAVSNLITTLHYYLSFPLRKSPRIPLSVACRTQSARHRGY